MEERRVAGVRESSGQTTTADPGLPPAPPVAELLLPGESVLAIRRNATWSPLPGVATAEMRFADVYLTSRRLFFIREDTLTSKLEDIVEVALAGDALLISMARGVGVRLLVDRPEMFRVNLAAARRAARAEHRAANR